MSEDGGDEFSEPALHGRPVPWMQELRPPSRRNFVLGTAAAGLVAAGAGVATGWLTSSGHGSPAAAFAPKIPPQLSAAVIAEQDMLVTVESALHGAKGATKQALRAIRDDHREHLKALQSALQADAFPAAPSASSAPTGAPSGSASSPSTPSTATVDEVRSAEQRAAKAAAARALSVSGRDAGLLASIAASEACHAAWLP
ncbi:MAG TPA: ferritin-like domain-containing protein [Jatrophihabitantaceae bacterium]|jgi:hypothetical protein